MNFLEVTPSHDDLIHDIAFDYYGKRFATCSSDKHLKIWTLDEDKGVWVCYDIPRAHLNSIWRLSWANPEFGQLLASCSEDNTICLWEENEPITASQEKDRWRKFKIATCDRSVNDVKFCHRSLGLKLAAASADGCLRIFEAKDVFDMNKWEIMTEYEVEDTTVQSADVNGDVQQQQQHRGASASSEHGLTCIAWNDCSFEGNKLAVGGYSKKAVVLSIDRNNSLKQECVLGEHQNAVHDIAWAPAMGRSYHLIATASKEPSFKVHKLTRSDDGSLALDSYETVENSTQSNIWRVTWNATGTVLSTSSEDGTLSLWRRNFSGQWINVQQLPSSPQQKMMHLYQGC